MAKLERSVAPSILPGKLNVLRQPRTAKSCWRVTLGADHPDPRFVEPSAQGAFAEFKSLRKKMSDAPLAIFGHMPDVGVPDQQQRAGAEAALAVVGVLTRDAGLWISAFNSGKGSRELLQDRLAAAGFPVGDPRGEIGDSTRDQLEAYLAWLFPFSPLDSGEITIVRSCSGFNPVLVTSESSAEDKKAERQKFNRRVVVLFLAPGTTASDWPCPQPGDGTGACMARFWSDRDKRAKRGTKPRLYRPPWSDFEVPKPYRGDPATMGCRFYERLIFGLGCEVGAPEVEPPPPPPPPPPKPEQKDWRIVLRCSHGRVNRDELGLASEDEDPDAGDRIEIVPAPSGDPILVYINPETLGPDVLLSTTTEGLFFDDDSVDLGTGEFPHTLFPEHEEPLVENPFWVLARYSTVAPSFVVTGEKDGETKEVRGVIYPDYEWTMDASEVLSKLAKAANEGLKYFTEVLELLAKEVNLRFAPDEWTVRMAMGWREYPAPPDVSHYLAYFHYEIVLGLNPLIEVDGEVELSLWMLLRKLSGLSAAGMALRKILDAMPKWVEETLSIVKATLTAEASAGGEIAIVRSNPTEPFNDYGPEDHEQKAEVRATARIAADARVDDRSLVERLPWLPDIEISITGEASVDFEVGAILRFEKEQLGFYVGVEGAKTSLEVVFDIPLVDAYRSKFALSLKREYRDDFLLVGEKDEVP